MLPNIIDSQENLEALITLALQKKCVAVDTEFVWERTYYPKLGVVQIGFSNRECFLVDVVALGDISLLGKLLSDPNVTKILHDAHQDLVILRKATGTFPKNIFDTQYAAGFIGESITISLRQLVHIITGVTLAKTETRTNWLQRPLTKNQHRYALDDVRYLPKIMQKILARTRKNGTDLWLQEDLEGLDNHDLYRERDTFTQIKRIRGTKRFTPQEMAVLFELVDWREREARTQDRPREHIVTEKTLTSITRNKPRNLTALKPMKEFPESKVAEYGAEIISAVNRGLMVPPHRHHQRRKRKINESRISAQVDLTQAFINGMCVNKRINPAAVSTRSEIAEFVRDHFAKTLEPHKIMKGWRKTFLGEKLQNILAGKYAISLDRKTGLPKVSAEAE